MPEVREVSEGRVRRKSVRKGCWRTQHTASGAVALLEIDTENSRDRKEKI